MFVSKWKFSLGAIMGVLLTLKVAAAPAGSPVQFNRDIRPLLSDQCFACHGFDQKKRKAGLRLDTAEGAYAANKDGRVAIKPGDPAGSELWRRLETTDPEDVMPPPETHKTVTPEQRALLKRWITEGAKYQQHWAFEAPVAVTPPVVKPGTPVRNGLDRFIAARLASEGLAPAPEADRSTLIRRLSFDLRGLPPTPAEVDRFLSDTQPDAYERLVDRLLESPAYGERMARLWLDVARYADTHGLHLDNEREMWAYRDWVVNAFNRNLPFDRFSIEQLAGDLLPNPTLDQQVATGFNRCNVSTSEGGSIDAEFIFRYAVDRTSTTVQTWMGLTAGCAVCHDHKFDPISAREFYSMYAFFHSAADPAMDGNERLTPPVMKLRSTEDAARVQGFAREAADVEQRVQFLAERTAYTDPASLTPPPEAREVATAWLEDAPPAGWKGDTSSGGQPSWASEPVHGGKRALVRQDGGLVQDVFETGDAKVEVPANARLYAHVWIDPKNPPRAVMLQFNREEWNHRAVWGDVDAIDWGAKNTTERAHLGPLPEAGQWVRLEFPAEKVGLKAGDRLKGLAFTQYGGRVAWDDSGVVGRVDPVNDPLQSFAAWRRQYEGKGGDGLPEAVRNLFLKSQPGERTRAQTDVLRTHYLARVCTTTRPGFAALLAEADGVRQRQEAFEKRIPSTFVWRDLDKPRDSFVMLRGQYDKPGEKVSRGVPAALPALRSSSVPSRLDLAQWLMSKEHPLTARVTVNRFWQQFFGMGLVKTADDFGSQGEPPSHPELLDWLSVTFRQGGWDVKGLVRLLVTSATYRQDAKVTPELWQRDPENRLLARGPRFRLDAEQVRDNALFVSGLLDPAMGGKGVKPYQPPNIWEPVGFVGSNTRDYQQDHGSALYRRSLYTFFKRTAPAPFMALFDAPNREQSCSRRERSNTPLQALQLLNDVQHFEAARGLASRMMSEGGRSADDRIAWAYRAVLSRAPAASEVGIVRAALEQHLTRYRADAESAGKAIRNGESQPPAGVDPAELAAYTLTANLLLNLDETVTRN